MTRSPLRLLVVAGGGLLVVLGFAVVGSGPAAVPGGLWLIVAGLVVIGATLLEHQRYRSASAEAAAEDPGPGGGEPVERPLDPRFRPTTERFDDPTTGRTMRVWVDASNGERRYRAED